MKNAVIYLVLVGFASLQMLGDLIGSRTLKGLGAASAMAPAMKVFTAHEGFETFSSRFFLEWSEGTERRTLELTPKTYSSLRGPYNRRNAYGAALAYGPVLNASETTRPILEAVMDYAMCEPGVLATELGIPSGFAEMVVRLEPRDPSSRDPRWQLEYDVNCGASS